MKFNCQRLNLLLVFLILFIGHQKYLQSAGGNGAIVQLISNETGLGPETYVTGVNTFDYLPVAWASDYGFPNYDREKYPEFFDRSIDGQCD